MRKLRVSLWAMEKELKDLESGICKKEKVIMSRDAIFDELSMFHSKFVENLTKTKDVTSRWSLRAP